MSLAGLARDRKPSSEEGEKRGQGNPPACLNAMKMLELELADLGPAPLPLRESTAAEDIDDLADSIAAVGLLNPLLVREAQEGYELICGQRRLLALRKLERKTAPALVLDSVPDPSALALAANLLQVDISPLERALALASASRRLSREELGRIVGRSPAYIARHLALLAGLDPEVLSLLREGRLTYGHAEALLRLGSKPRQRELARRIVAEELNVNEAELVVDQARPPEELSERERELNEVEESVIRCLGEDWRRRVGIRQGTETEKLVIEFSGRRELREFLRKIADGLSEV